MYSGDYRDVGGVCYYKSKIGPKPLTWEAHLYGYLVADPECEDLCPDDPDKKKPGACGCGVPDKDSDSDAVMDCKDQCPSDPLKALEGECGCGVADLDGDGDGLADCKDNCPLTPQGCYVDSQGCAVDRDGDGNADCFEMCPSDSDRITPGLCGCNSDPYGEKDDDGDDVANCLDQCPDELGNGPDGCLDPLREIGIDENLLKDDTCQDEKSPYNQGDPISILSGNHTEKETDITFSSPFEGEFVFTRFYNSRSSAESILGVGWTHNYHLTFERKVPARKPVLCESHCDFETRSQLLKRYSGWTVIKETQPTGGRWGKVALCSDEKCPDVKSMATATYCQSFEYLCTPDVLSEIIIKDETGFSHRFRELKDDLFLSLNGDHSSLTIKDGLYLWRRANGILAAFDPDINRLVWLEDQNGNRREVTYDSEYKNIFRIADKASGRTLRFVYTGNHVSAIDLYTGDSADYERKVSYTYDENYNLTGATYGDGSGIFYEYNDKSQDSDTSAHVNNMTRKTNAAGHLLATWTYDATDRCIANTTPNGTGVTLGFENYPHSVTVTDAYDISRIYHFIYINGQRRIQRVEGVNGCAACSQEAVRMEYDQKANVIEKEFANGRIDHFRNYDDNGYPGTVIRAQGSPEERVISYTWHPALKRPLTRSEQSVLAFGDRQTIWDYDDDENDIANENPTLKVHRILKSGFTLNGSGDLVPMTAVTRLDYDDRGLLISKDGPMDEDADAVFFDYDPVTGDLLSIAKSSGTVTFSSYDASGMPGRITDANGNTLVYSYDAAGRPTAVTRLWDMAVTRITYTTAGLPDTIILPDGEILTYQYDPVFGRLTGITDNRGNRVAHGYDDQGHVIDTAYFSVTGGQTFWQGFDYGYPQRPGKLWRQIYANGGSYEYAYDNVGNLNQVTDPAGRITSYGFDTLNRLASTIQPGGITTDLHFDSQGNLALVTDPATNTTEYRVDDFGRVVQAVSPDSGVATYTYDVAGNLISGTDANQITTTYTYDAQNRLTAVHYPDPGQDVTLAYDDGVNAKGRLTGLTDAGGTYHYSYDAAGNITSETHTLDGNTFTTGYDYDAAGRITRMTYPNGRVVTYLHDETGNVANVATEQGGVADILADKITYLPFGPRNSMTLGNGLKTNRSYNRSYRLIENRTEGIQDQQFTRDVVGNVTTIGDSINPASGLSLLYDDLYRLTGATGDFGQVFYSYDANGNRLTRIGDNLNSIYTYTPGTNQLALVADDKLTDIVTDAAGNIIMYGDLDLTYNFAGRLASVEAQGVLLGSYTYSADGRRVKKTANGQTTLFHYDLNGRLIAESNDQGVFTKLYLYLEDTPLAMITVNDANQNIYYYHTDHLGTPQLMTDDAGNIVWAAEYLPFGRAEITTETIDNNLRFAGQYFDAETGLHYNYWRYYDPALGRYLRVDPIGLEGGMNPFVYVGNNPLNLNDLYGLFGDGINAGGKYLGHSDFAGNDRFEYTIEDYDPVTSPINIFTGTARHFRDLKDVEHDLINLIIKRRNPDKEIFERYMHQGQDFFSHYSKGYRWPLGHLLDGTKPDKDKRAWEEANEWTKKWLERYDKIFNECE